MERARAKTVESIFHEALARPPAEREKFLAEACQGDSDLQREVVSLLEAYDSPGGLLDSDALAFLQQEPELPPVLREGDRIASYRIVRLLGKGGMGEVYEAYDERLQRPVAVKTLPKSFVDDPGRVERLKREARTVSALNHPNILTIYDFGRQADIEFIVSELVEGVSLRELIGKLTRLESINYVRQIGEALKAAHAAGVIHRDIKPENVMVRPDGYVKVLDFGLAKVQAPPPVSPASAQPLSEPGLIVGTPNYMSPEQRRGDTLDQRTDIWSWGVVFYEMLAGRRPFDVALSGDKEIVLAQGSAPPCKDRRLNRLVARALAVPVSARYQTMDEALRELAAARPRPWPSWFLKPTAAILLLGLLVALLANRKRVIDWLLPHQPLRLETMVALTTSGNVRMGAVSPDGYYVAFVTEDSRGQSLKMVQLGTHSETEKLPPLTGNFSGLTFSPDGQFIYYVLEQNFLGKLYRLPLIAGKPQLVANDVDSAVSFSPDGSQYVFRREYENRHESSLILRSVEGSYETILVSLKYPTGFWRGPLWSPDGTYVLCGAYTGGEASPRTKIVSVRISDKSLREIGTMSWKRMDKPVWIKQGQGIIVAAAADDSNRRQLVEVTLDTGRVMPFSHDTEDYLDLDATPDANKIVGVVVHRESNLWVTGLAGPEKPRLVASGKYDFVAWAKSGQVVSQTETGGQTDLWSIDVKTGEKHRITDDSYVETDPVVSLDQKQIVYSSNRDGSPHLWRSNLDGSDPVRLTSGASLDQQPAFTPDGKWIIYSSNRSGRTALWKISSDGGTPAQITPEMAQQAEVSPNGALIACNSFDLQTSRWSTVALRADNGEIQRSFPRVPGRARVHWSPDGKGLLFLSTENGVSNVWFQPIDGGVPRQLTHYSEETIFAFSPSSDGTSVALVRGRQTSNLVLLKGAH